MAFKNHFLLTEMCALTYIQEHVTKRVGIQMCPYDNIHSLYSK